MKHSTKVLIPKEDFEWLEPYLRDGKMVEKYDKDGVVVTFTGKFDNGVEVDIKVCNALTENGGAYVDTVLFDNGCEIAVSEVTDSLTGEWYVCASGEEYEIIPQIA